MKEREGDKRDIEWTYKRDNCESERCQGWPNPPCTHQLAPLEAATASGHRLGYLPQQLGCLVYECSTVFSSEGYRAMIPINDVFIAI